MKNLRKLFALLLILLMVNCSTEKKIIIDTCTPPIEFSDLDTIIMSVDFYFPSKKMTLIGKVIDAQDSTGLIGAPVTVLSGSREIAFDATDGTGKYRLDFFITGNDTLQILYLGYNKKKIGILDKVSSLLQQEKKSLK